MSIILLDEISKVIHIEKKYMKMIKIINRCIDMFMSFIVLMISIAIVCCLYVNKRKKVVKKKRNLLVIDTAYSYRAVKSFGREHFVLQRKLGGYFNHVYSLYPIHGSNPADYDDKIEKGVRFIHFKMSHLFVETSINYSKIIHYLPGTNFILSQLKMILVAREIVYRCKISMIRGGDPFFTGLYSYVLSKLTDTPFTLRIGGNYDLLYKNGTMLLKNVYKFYFVQKIIARFIFKRCELIAAANESYKNYCVKNGANSENVFIARFGNNMDPIHFVEPSKRCELPEKIKIILGKNQSFCVYVGRVTAVKHPEDLIYFMKEFVKERSEMRMLYIGEGDLLDNITSLAKKMGVEKNVVFTGKMTQKDIANILPNACFYISTHSGSSLAEAALSGIPIIAYDYEWQSEIVIDGITGELVEYRNWELMVKSASRIMNDKKYAKTLGINVRKFAMDLMDQKKIQDIEMKNYEKIIGNIL